MMKMRKCKVCGAKLITKTGATCPSCYNDSWFDTFINRPRHSIEQVREIQKKAQKKVEEEFFFGEVAKVSEIDLICINDMGLDGFTEGMEYLGKAHADNDFYWVYNNRGEQVEVFADRFERMKTTNKEKTI